MQRTRCLPDDDDDIALRMSAKRTLDSIVCTIKSSITGLYTHRADGEMSLGVGLIETSVRRWLGDVSGSGTDFEISLNAGRMVGVPGDRTYRCTWKVGGIEACSLRQYVYDTC